MVCDVVIAGAGPNGLMLACELRLAGVHPVVLERLSEPSPENRANGLVGQVVRMLDRRGLYQPLAGESGPPQPMPAFFFGAVTMDLHTLDDNPFYLLPVPQTRIERVLADRAADLSVEVRGGHPPQSTGRELHLQQRSRLGQKPRRREIIPSEENAQHLHPLIVTRPPTMVTDSERGCRVWVSHESFTEVVRPAVAA